MKRKLLSILALLCLTVSGAWADDSGSCGTSLTYSYVESTHTLTISGTGEMTKFDLFKTKAPWDGYKASITSVVIESGVTSIGEYAFKQCTSLASVTIPTSVTNIGKSAFEQCSSLTTIDIPASVTTIGNGAFGRTGLTEIDIPASVTTLGSSVFMSCTNLTTVSIPTSVTSIGQSVFYGCSNLKSANLPDNLTSIPSQLFYQCTSLEAITIPASVTSIGSSAFYGCNNASLTSISIPASVTSIESQAFRNCTGLTSIDLPANLTTIGVYAFSGCNNASLTLISIPASVTSIGQSAFRNCSNLGTVTLNSNPTIGTDAFTGIADGAAVTMNLTANSAGGAKWATFYNKLYSFEADANTQVFKAGLSGTSITLYEVTDKIVNAGTGVVLKSTGNPVMTLTTSASSNADSNSLEGVSDAAGQTSDGTMYVLNYKAATGVGFYKLTSGKTLGVGKAYLTYSGAGANGFFGFGETTSINEELRMKNEEFATAPVYDLQGRRVAQPAKGLYIVNGKKVVIK